MNVEVNKESRKRKTALTVFFVMMCKECPVKALH